MSTLTRDEIQGRSDAVIAALIGHVDNGSSLCVVKAPPGSGKTHTLLNVVAHATQKVSRIAIAAQTNAQANDICERLSRLDASLPITRFAAASADQPPSLAGVNWVVDKSQLPYARSIVVSTTAKWSLVDLPHTYDLLFVDEAWQMSWADFMLLGNVAGRFVLIGDPGQIPPVVPIPVERWETSPRAPHHPAPELILRDPSIYKEVLELPACRRLPSDSVELVRGFYDFDFASWARDGERSVRVGRVSRHHDAIDDCIDLLADTSVVIASVPSAGPVPLEADEELANIAAAIARRLLESHAEADCGDGHRELTADQIGLGATHRIMNHTIAGSLANRSCRVDTPERWQGLERPVMVVVHPLSGVTQPSAFDLETGRLCVMASRHQAGLIIVSRDHVPETLNTHLPMADQAVGRPDVSGRGHAQNQRFWEAIEAAGHVIRVA